MSEWKEDSLANHVSLITKGTTPTSLGKDFQENGINFIKAESITDAGEFIPSMFAFIDKETHELLKRSQLQDGDILFSIAGVLGRIAVVNQNVLPANTNQAIAIIRLSSSSEIENDFLKHFLNGEFVQEQIRRINVQAAQANFSLADINRLNILYPTYKKIQTKIAKILSTADALIEKTQAVIAKYKAIKQGMLQDLFTRGLTSEKVKVTSEKGEEEKTTWKLRPRFEDAPELYQKSKLGWIPREWDEKKLGECGTFRKGGNIPKYSLSHSGVGCILYGQLYTTYHETIKKVFSKVPDIVVDNMNPLKFGSILFAGSGETHEEIGKCVVFLNIDEEIYAGGDVVILDLNDEYFKPLFGYYLNFQPIQSQKSKFGQGSSVIHIYSNHLSAIDLALPPRNEQKRIFEVIDQLNNKLQTEQAYLQKMQLLKKGLMEDLLSGRKKVNVDEELVTQENKEYGRIHSS